MIQVLSAFVLSLCVFVVIPFSQAAARPVSTHQTSTPGTPDYAKWGQLAMIQTQKKYPHTQIVDYRHVGRKTRSQDMAEETFRLWLRESSSHKEFGVFVTIVFRTSDEQVVSTTFQEVSH